MTTFSKEDIDAFFQSDYDDMPHHGLLEALRMAHELVYFSNENPNTLANVQSVVKSITNAILKFY